MSGLSTRRSLGVSARARRRLGAGVLLLGLAACARYSHLDIQLGSNPPRSVRIASDVIELDVGTAILIDVQPESSTTRKFDTDDIRLRLSAQDGTIAQLLPVSPSVDNQRRGENDDQWIVVGADVGSTCIEVRIDGELEDCIELVVRDQAAF